MTVTREREPDLNATITAFVDELVVALINCRIYWSEHPRVQASIQELLRILPKLAQLDIENRVQLGIADEQLVFRQRPLLGASLAASRLIHAMSDRGAGGIEFHGDAAEEDFQALFEVLSERVEGRQRHGRTNRRLADRGCRNIRLLGAFGGGATESGGFRSAAGPDASGAWRTEVPFELYQNIVTLLQDTTISLCHGGLIEFTRAQDAVDGVIKNLEKDAGSMMGVGRYERYDAFTFGHSIRVALLALQFARTLTSERNLLNRIGVAALLHDVGKARVPFEILHARGRLSAEQRAEMEKHPVYGAEILLDHDGCDPMAYTAAFGHHQCDRDRGYPRTLHDVHLSLVTRIVKICDVYEALTAVRPYKPAMPPVRAYRIMMSMRGHFDPPLLRRFIEVIGAFPTGSLVRLDNGAIGRVREQSGRLELPVVEVITGPGGEELAAGDRAVVDLSRPGRDPKPAIAGIASEVELEAVTR